MKYYRNTITSIQIIKSSQNRNNMNKPTGGLLRDIRNIKRNITLFQSPQDIITSAKQLKKIRSSQQININTFMDNKNQKIKNIDQKLEYHESQIERNNRIIKELTDEFVLIKEQFIKEKEKTLSEEKKNKLLKEQIERTNKLLRAKTLKVDQLTKQKENLQKQIQAFKPVLQKNDEYIKTIAGLRKQLTTMQETALEVKQKMDEKQKQFLKLKENSSEIQTLKAQISLLKQETSAKDSIINNYKISIHEYSIQKDKDISQKLNFQKQIEKFHVQLDEIKKTKNSVERKYIESQKKLSQATKKQQSMESSRHEVQSKAKNHQSQENRAHSQLHQLKQKNQDMIAQYNQKVTECNISNTKIQKGNQKVKELQLKVCNYKNEKDKLVQIEQRFSDFKLKGKNLENLYNTMLPQIQCPYGHELKQPVTIIPCGHNYCLGCKKGYHKDCSQCKGKLKIEAVYRNELMDDIIGIIGGIRQVIDLVK